jgi:hypothetical protein
MERRGRSRALALMKSLIARKAIPEVRTKYFTDADFDVGGGGRSRAEIFEKNGTHAFPRLTEPSIAGGKRGRTGLGLYIRVDNPPNCKLWGSPAHENHRTRRFR